MKRLFLAVIALLSFAACTENADLQPTVEPTADFAATFAQTRTDLDGTAVIWNENDLLTIFTKTSHNRQYKIKEMTADRRSATFGYVSYTGSDNTKIATNYAIYPYDAAATLSAGVVTTTLAPEQNYNPENGTLSYALMAAASADNCFNFENTTALMRFKVSVDENLPDTYTLNAIKVASANNKIAGEVTIDLNAETKVAVVTENGVNEVVLTDINSTITTDVQQFYLALPATSFADNDVTVTFFFEEGEKTFELPAFELTQSTIKTVVYNIKSGDDFIGNTPGEIEKPANNEIWYTSYDGEIVTPYDTNVFGANIVSNTYENGKGIITFDGDISSIGEYAFYQCACLTSIDIPKSVTSVNDYAFTHCVTLKHITIPENTTYIGDEAFLHCDSLADIHIPDSVTSIGKAAFYDCSNLTHIAIPNGVTLIEDSTFKLCDKLANITIPESVISIGEDAFWYCISLSNITLPNSITSIGETAFTQCYSLTTITIPDSVISIGPGVFNNCNNIRKFQGKFTTEDGLCLIINNTLIAFATGCDKTTYEIPNNVTTIGRYAFRSCSSLTNVAIPNSVTTIGIGAFETCSNLTSVTIPDSVTEIGNYAFYDCNSLATITIPNSVTSIGKGAFWECCLTSVTIPDSVTSIGKEAFAECRNLTKVYCKPTTPPTGGANIFGNNTSLHIYVPAQSVNAYKTAENWSQYNIIGEGVNTGLYIHGASTDFESANVAEAMEYVEEDVFSITAFFAQSQNNEILISKEQSATYPCYALAANGEVVTITSPETTYTPLEIEANGLRKLTVNLNTLTWSWERITNQFAMPDSELSNYPTKSYIARDGSMKTWMTRHMAWDGGDIYPKLGSGMVKHTGTGTVGTGGYPTSEFPTVWNDATRINPAYETVESGLGNLETYSDDGRIYTYHEMLGYEARFGIGYARYENGPWWIGEKYTDARGTTYTIATVSRHAEEYTGDNTQDETLYPMLKVQAQGICPYGWHVANASDWLDLFYAMGKASETGTHTYPVNTADCTYKQMINGGVPNINGWLRNTKDWGTDYIDEGADEFGFNYYPLGYRYMTQGFQNWSMRVQVWVPLPMAGSHPDDYPSAGGGRINVIVKNNKTMTTALANIDIGQAVCTFRCVKNYK